MALVDSSDRQTVRRDPLGEALMARRDAATPSELPYDDAAISHETLVPFLAERFPEHAPLILSLAQDVVGTYGVVSEVLWWPVLEPMIRAGSHDDVVRALQVVDELLARGTPIVVDAVGIRVTPYLIPLGATFRAFMGDHTLRDMERARGA